MNKQSQTTRPHIPFVVALSLSACVNSLQSVKVCPVVIIEASEQTDVAFHKKIEQPKVKSLQTIATDLFERTEDRELMHFYNNVGGGKKLFFSILRYNASVVYSIGLNEKEMPITIQDDFDLGSPDSATYCPLPSKPCVDLPLKGQVMVAYRFIVKIAVKNFDEMQKVDDGKGNVVFESRKNVDAFDLVNAYDKIERSVLIGY